MVVKSHASIDVDEDGMLVYSLYGVYMMIIDFIETVNLPYLKVLWASVLPVLVLLAFF